MNNSENIIIGSTIKKQWFRLRYILGLGVLLLILFQISYFFDIILYEIFNISFYSLFTKIVGIITQAAAFIVVIGVGLKDQRKTLSSVCFFKKVSGWVLGAAILCSIGYTLFTFYFNELFYSFLYGWDMDWGVTRGNFFINLIDIAIIPAVAEELLIKGLVFTILRKHYSTITSVIIASLMFAVLHLTPIRIIPLLFDSCFTFWVYLCSGSLILPMLLHFVHNLFAFVLISEPFSSLGTFYAALVLFIAGSYLLHKLNKLEKKPQIDKAKQI
jgi:membrane protease YdiL (CAAX protease family)